MPKSILDEDYRLGELVDPGVLEDILSGFAETFGVGLGLFDSRAQRVAEVRRTTPACEGAPGHECERPRQLLLARKAAMLGGPPGPQVERCPRGCRLVRQDVENQLEHVGMVVVGPVAEDAGPSAGPADGGASPAAAPGRGIAPEALARLVAQVIAGCAYAGQQRLYTSKLHLAAMEEHHRELTVKHAALLDAKARLEEMDRLKSAFLATVSHELRTPLTSVIGYSEMLLEGLAGPLAQEQREYLRTIREKGDQLLALIQALLDISRIEAGTVSLSCEPLELAELVRAAVEAVRPSCRRKNLALEVEIAEGMPRVEADRDKLRAVLANLLSNAVKFTAAEGRIAVQARARTRPVLGEALEVAIPDTGIGIAKEHLRKILDPFFQVDSSSTRAYGGVGLGLTIAKSWVEAHGGQLLVESEQGQGSQFTVALPLGRTPRPGVDGAGSKAG